MRKRKLSGRKFWAAVVGFVTVPLTAFSVGSITGEQVISVTTTISIPVVCIVGESLADCVVCGLPLLYITLTSIT